MRWDNLFDDLESQLEHELRADRVDQSAEEERLRLGRLTIRDRIAALREAGADVALTLGDGEQIVVRPASFGRDWLSGAIVGTDLRTVQCVVPIAAIASIILAADRVEASTVTPAAETVPAITERIGLQFVLRDLCRRRSAVRVGTRHGSFTGTIDRVGRDHFDLAEHEAGDIRRQSAVLRYRLIPFDQLLVVRV
ncbi:hypothetical protein [Diaminobutyricimonas sp. LJ205]|uniref:hypothetical protein n=1 Tax=Diaminobutyricimonas sp. LJ205 TaxID=2683590 RepID=UPI0012F522D9|nr:hypothetical protein [Diaminobutyricimonas sp. LJ205]